MSWQRNYVVLPSGERIRYSLLGRPDSDAAGIYVRFQDRNGRRVKKSTGEAKKAQAVAAAHRIIMEDYGEVAKPRPKLEIATWEEAEDRLKEEMEADGKRPKTIKGYVETLGKFKAIFPSARGPADVTEAEAGQFKTKYAVGKGAGGNKHSVKSLDSRLRSLKAAFGWFKRMRLVEQNAFENVPQPELDHHEVKYVKTEDLQHFYNWLGNRYPGWEMPQLFFQVKALTGCRLDDLCNIRSEQLRDGRIVFPASATKNRSERHAKLPADVFAQLDTYKGRTFVWERYPAELIEQNKSRHCPVHRQNAEFSPRRLYNWIEQTMQTYQKETDRDLSSHDFRKAAFTRAAEADIHPKRAAAAFDVTPETMMRFYTATEKTRTADDVLGGLADKLRLKGKANGRTR